MRRERERDRERERERERTHGNVPKSTHFLSVIMADSSHDGVLGWLLSWLHIGSDVGEGGVEKFGRVKALGLSVT